MKTVTLYTGGGVSLSPKQIPGSVEAEFVRLVADDGFAITDGNAVLAVADVNKAEVSLWTDCDLPPVPPDPDPDIDDAEAFDIIFGGAE